MVSRKTAMVARLGKFEILYQMIYHTEDYILCLALCSIRTGQPTGQKSIYYRSKTKMSLVQADAGMMSRRRHDFGLQIIQMVISYWEVLPLRGLFRDKTTPESQSFYYSGITIPLFPFSTKCASSPACVVLSLWAAPVCVLFLKTRLRYLWHSNFHMNPNQPLWLTDYINYVLMQKSKT